MKKIISVSQCLSEIISDLEEGGRDHYVEELEGYMVMLSSEEQALHALERIQGLCHIRILGDLDVPGIEPDEWLNKIEKLSQKCRRTINANSKNNT